MCMALREKVHEAWFKYQFMQDFQLLADIYLYSVSCQHQVRYNIIIPSTWIYHISLGEIRLKTDLLEHTIIYIGTDKLL